MEGVQVHNMYQMGLYHQQQQQQQQHKSIKSLGLITDQDHMNNVTSEDELTSSSSSSSFGNSNNVSNESSSSSDLLDDASSSSSSSNGPLFQLSGLMDQLPIKRGLSKYYQGKSQSFTSLARVASLEDLAKKESPYQRRLKACRSYGGGLNHNNNNNNNNNSFKSFTQPKPTISKKVNKGSLSNLSCMSRNNSFMNSLPPLSPVQKTF